MELETLEKAKPEQRHMEKLFAKCPQASHTVTSETGGTGTVWYSTVVITL